MRLMITSTQVRAARALLGWSRQKLAKEASIPYGTLSDFETNRTRMMSDSLGMLMRALDRAGVEFLYDGQDDKGPGVRLKHATGQARKPRKSGKPSDPEGEQDRPEREDDGKKSGD